MLAHVCEICAVDFACFGYTPVQPAEWYDLPLLDFYGNLTFTSGLSSTDSINPAQRSTLSIHRCRDPDMATEDVADMDDRYANLATASGLSTQSNYGAEVGSRGHSDALPFALHAHA